jgi:peptide/nickel transport system substrate-binding protein
MTARRDIIKSDGKKGVFFMERIGKIILTLICLLGILWPGASAAGWPQKIVIGEDTDISGFDPALSESPFAFRPLLYNGLLELDLDFKIVPGLAVKWQGSRDGKEWTFFLREGVKFSDGTALDAQIVKKNFDRLKEGPQKGWLSGVDEVIAQDRLTVRFRMKSPNFIFDSHVTPPFLSIVGASAFDEKGKVVKAVGTGPFIVESWKKGQECVLKANPVYWGGKPRVESLVFKIIRDPDARAMALEAGNVDLISFRSSLTATERIARNEKFRILKRTGQTSEVIFCNTDIPQLADRRVRLALAAALDIPKMIPQLLGDSAEPGALFFAPGFGEYVSPRGYVPPYDPSRAKSLLAEAGWQPGPSGVLAKDGRPLSLKLTVVGKNAENMLLAGAIQHSLKAVGCDLSLLPVENAAIVDDLKNRKYDLLMLGQWLIPHNEPSTHYRYGYYHEKSTYRVFVQPELTALIDRLEGTASGQERVKLHHEIQNRIADEIPTFMIFHRNNLVGVKRDLADLRLSVGTWQLYRDLARP